MTDITPELVAINQFLARPVPVPNWCACLGPQPLPGQPQCNGANWDEIKREPVCPCAMKWIEEVNGSYYHINVTQVGNDEHVTADFIGPVGGPYVKA